MRSVGIDIGSTSIKVAEIEATSKSFRLWNVTEHFLNQDPNQDTQIDVLDFVKKTVEQYDPSVTRFVLGIGQQHLCIRNKTFPFRERQKILKSLPFELEEDIPFNLENAVYDSKVLRIRGAESEVLACACPKTQVQKVVDLCNDTHMDVAVISSEGYALANLFENWNDTPITLPITVDNIGNLNQDVRDARIILHFGHDHTLVLIMDGTALITLRTIMWGGRNVARAIAQQYRISYLEALKEMQQKAFVLLSHEGATRDQITFSETITTQLREFGRELRLVLIETKSDFNLNYTSVGLSGGPSRIQNIGAYLTQLIELPCNQAEYIGYIPHLECHVESKLGAVGCVAIGLAIEGLKRPRNPPLSFLKQEFTKEGKSFKVYWHQWGVTIQTAAAIFALLLVYGMLKEGALQSLADQTYESLTQQAKQSAQLSEKKATPSNIQKFIESKKKLAEDQKIFVSLLSMNSALDILKELNDALPSQLNVKLDIQQFSVDDERLSFNGFVNAAEIGLIRTAAEKIAKPGTFREIPASLQPTDGRIAFAFEMQVDRKVKGKRK